MGPTGRCIKMGDPLPPEDPDSRVPQDYSYYNPKVSLNLK